MDDHMIERMQSISQNYSKDKGRKGITFEQDAETKRQSASPEILDAAKTFAGDIYQQLETLSSSGATKQSDGQGGQRLYD